jgi:purine-binding chemotaxis protein CheW
VGEVLPLNPQRSASPNPPTLDPVARVSRGVHRQGDRLLIVLDVERLLELGT